MKAFLLKVALFFLLVAAIDTLTGYAFNYMATHAKGGDTGRDNFICNQVDDDILVFGSSRAVHHYNPKIITDSLGLSCYNCGQEGNGVILNYGRYHLIGQRYQPKVVIYDVAPRYDLWVSEDNHKYLDHLRQYYDRPGISEIFQAVDPTERYKMLSWMYRYNSKCFQLAGDFIHPMHSSGIKGYLPYAKATNDSITATRGHEDYVCDTLKLAFIHKMVEKCSDTRFIFVASPWWDGRDVEALAPIKQYCSSHAIPFIDYSNHPKYLHHNEFFKDNYHLNARGADEFTRDLTGKLKIALKDGAQTRAK